MAVGIITVLNPLSQFQKAQDAKRKGDLSQIQKALETYYQDNGKYPAYSATDLVYSYRIVRLDGTTADWGTQFQPYIAILPKDPLSTKKYAYYSSLGRQTYYLYASLDRGSLDPQACNQGNACASLNSNGILDTACVGTCNYGVSSPNVNP